MGAFLIAISLLSASVFGMSQDATTEPFVKCFPEWAEADQVLVICNDIKIAQYCDQSCRTMNKPGVSLEKGSNDVCLTITDCSYDLCSCEATSFIDHKPQESKKITVDVCNQHTNTSLSAGHPDTAPRSEWTRGVIIGLIVIVLIGLIVLMVLFRLIRQCIYKKVKSSNGHPIVSNQQDLEMGQRAVAGENEPMEEDKVMLETEVLGQNGKMFENGELGENGQQEERPAKIKKKTTPCATSSKL